VFRGENLWERDADATPMKAAKTFESRILDVRNEQNESIEEVDGEHEINNQRRHDHRSGTLTGS